MARRSTVGLETPERCLSLRKIENPFFIEGPPFAQSAKDGPFGECKNPQAVVCIVTHPRKEREDGAPSVC